MMLNIASVLKTLVNRVCVPNWTGQDILVTMCAAQPKTIPIWHLKARNVFAQKKRYPFPSQTWNLHGQRTRSNVFCKHLALLPRLGRSAVATIVVRFYLSPPLRKAKALKHIGAGIQVKILIN